MRNPKAAAAAQAAFEDGMALMEKGEYERACRQLESSVKLDPAMAATFRWAQCLEKIGKLASAWRQFTSVAAAARAAGMKDREDVAHDRAIALEPRLSRLLITVPDELYDVPDVTILRNGEVVPRDHWNEPQPVDVGNHALVARVAGKEAWVSVVAVQGEGNITTAAVPMLQPPAQAAPQEGGNGEAHLIAGVVTMSAGLVSMGVGGIVALLAKQDYDESNLHCVADRCTDKGIEIRHDAIVQADVATAVIAVGGAITVGGIVLWLTAPVGGAPAETSDAGAWRLRASLSGVSLLGSW